MTDTPEIPDEEIEQRVKPRTEFYESLGVPFTHAFAQAGTELGYDREVLADYLNVEPNTISVYKSKFSNNADEAIMLALSHLGGEKYIHAVDKHWDLYNRENWMVIATPIEYGEYASGDDLHPHNHRVVTIHLRAGGPSGEPDGSINISTSKYNSLDALADEKYENASAEKRESWLPLFKDAVGAENPWLETLPGAWEDTGPGHPDHPNHENHQLRSAEPTERRGPPRR